MGCWPDSHLSSLLPLTGLLLAVCQALENSTSALSGESHPLGVGWCAEHCTAADPGCLVEPEL